MALIVDRELVDASDVQQLINRIDELEAAVAAALHVNQHLNKEIDRCVREHEQSQAECKAWKDRCKWLTSQLIKDRQKDKADEAQALAEMLERYEARDIIQEQKELDKSQTDPDFQLSPSQSTLIKKLAARGAVAGWLIDASEVAVKVVHVRDAKNCTNFLREVEALAALRHPHILPFLGACMTRLDQFWLVTEYMEGGTLADWLHPNRRTSGPKASDTGWPHEAAHDQQNGASHLAPQHHGGLGPSTSNNGPPTSTGGAAPAASKPKSLLDRVRMASEVAQGLQAMETLQPTLLHRDVKPSNIFVDGGGHARVGDFGLARRLLPETITDLTGETGTYLYMAPEVMRHEIYDSKADVWSWGVLFVEALTAQKPYMNMFMLPEQVALGVAAERLRPDIPHHVDADLQAIAHWALSFNPEDRPTFSAICAELSGVYNRLLSKQDSSASAPSLLSSVSQQLTVTWMGLLKRIYNTVPPSTEAAAKLNTVV